jgi:hypothetical protein
MLKAVVLALICTGLAMASPVISVITFDGAPTPDSAYGLPDVYGDLPSGYAGYTWYGWQVLSGAADAILYADTTPGPLGSNFAYPNISAGALWVNSDSPFEFLSADLEAWPDTSGPDADSITIVGFLDGELVGAVTEDIYPTLWVQSGGITGMVDTLVFEPTDLYFKLDDLTLLTDPTPEPGTMTLLGAALAVIGLVQARAAKKAHHRSAIMTLNLKGN